MKVSELCAILENGGKIRSTGWPPGTYIVWAKELNCFLDEKGQSFMPSLTVIMNGDYEEYNEPFLAVGDKIQRAGRTCENDYTVRYVNEHVAFAQSEDNPAACAYFPKVDWPSMKDNYTVTRAEVSK